MMKDSTLTSEIIDGCIDSLKLLLMGNKEHLEELIINCIALMIKDPARGKVTFAEINKVNINNG